MRTTQSKQTESDRLTAQIQRLINRLEVKRTDREEQERRLLKFETSMRKLCMSGRENNYWKGTK